MNPRFIHLRLHTEYSLVDGVVRIKPLIKTLSDRNAPAVALTDQSNLFAMVKFYRAAMSAGIKPIVGVDVWLRSAVETEKPSRMVLLCQNNEGYLNVTQLISRAYLEGQHGGIPMIEVDWLRESSAGIIALSGGREGDVGRALLSGNQMQAEALLKAWQHIFPDRFYLELQRTGREDEEEYLHAAVSLAMATNTPVVATNDVRFLKQDEFDSHEVRVCIHDGRTLDDPRRQKLYSDQQYLRTEEEMCELFADIPEALQNTVEIAQRCSIDVRLGESFLPNFPIPEGDTIESYFIRVSKEGLDKRLEILVPLDSENAQERRKPYYERLDIELDVINTMGFPGYFLIVADFIQWSKDNEIPVGPGRGSGAGSLVAYALLITDLDPLEYELLFERFLNPERVSLPDFDVDFCMDGRDRVIAYVAETYGRDAVSQIITYGSMAAKAVIRDVGRVSGLGYGFVDRIAKMIPFEIGMTLTKALDESDDLANAYKNEADVTDLINMCLSLEGCTRNAGKHAGGVVISPSVLTDFTPLYCEQGGHSIVTQFDKDDVEAIGLVKFDFLGLRTLTIIDWAVRNIKARHADQHDLDINRIVLDDEKAFTLLKASETTAVFQLESSGMKDLIKRLQPDCFEDIIALVALFRPGPLQSGMVDNFINRKHGREEVSYPDAQYQHESLKPILEPTYGIILYQEQVMQIAQVLSGYTLGGADMLRRAMGKKKAEVMAEQRAVFEAGALENGIDSELSMKIFDLVEKFAGYGFNKSHSAAYALLSYQTAWLKAHYPAEFMAAVLSADMDNTDKVVILIEDCHRMELEVLTPNINRSIIKFSVPDETQVLYGLGAIKGVGDAALEGIIEERDNNGAYKDLYDLCRRVDGRKVNKRVLEALIKAGALQELGPNRASLMARLRDAMQGAEQYQKNASIGQDDLFGSAAEEDTIAPIDEVTVAEWEEEKRLTFEKDTLGLYLTGHPIERYEKELRKFTDCSLGALADQSDLASGAGGGYMSQRNAKSYKLAGLMIGMRVRKTKTGGKIVSAVLDDRTARVEVRIFEEKFEQYNYLLNKDKLIIVEGKVIYDDYFGGYRITADTIYDITEARQKFAQRLEINLKENDGDHSIVHQLNHVLNPFREGNCPIWINYTRNDVMAKISLSDDWRVQPSDELINRLDKLAGDNNVSVIY
ncbi:MAG: DNA polymerase III subunit alpha [endosymbiont of Galathealinum brachiosum]|uniref:DNA polymerase III subunit alpha n=1 Tax=endosymbiont of Galathealinum brachiosum TaxID=2200906 RepID=A0A370DK36_9GAMM|nr:MAG: DNA polymerase III subunit alpha [endosymbiont of Galathealinum brachiosum]